MPRSTAAWTPSASMPKLIARPSRWTRLPTTRSSRVWKSSIVLSPHGGGEQLIETVGERGDLIIGVGGQAEAAGEQRLVQEPAEQCRRGQRVQHVWIGGDAHASERVADRGDDLLEPLR